MFSFCSDTSAVSVTFAFGAAGVLELVVESEIATFFRGLLPLAGDADLLPSAEFTLVASL